jgi:tRNA threonylcarbamoyladenosine biosynthesis protein TsaE
MPSWVCATEAETETAGRAIAHLLPEDAVVHLMGDLGSGKTFLVRAIASELGADPLEVSSPSFAIVHEYPRAGHTPIIHIDGYRLSDRPREWMEIGIPEMLTAPGLKLIEWPKREFEEFEDSHVEIAIRVLSDGSREVSFSPQASGLRPQENENRGQGGGLLGPGA